MIRVNLKLASTWVHAVSRIRYLHYTVCISLLLTAFVAGCSNGDNSESALANANGTNLQRLANLYIAYQTEHDWRGPQDEPAFKTFLKGVKAATLERIGIDPNQIDALFISERDGQPFKIRYGVAGSVMGSSEPVVFEATGDGTTRQVGFLNMQQRAVDATEYDALWSGKATNPPQPARR